MSAAGGYSIRVLTVDDWQAFSIMRLEALQKYPQFFGSSYEREKAYSSGDWQQWLIRQDACLFGLFDKERIIGITGAITDKYDAAIGMMIASYIQPEYQGRGLSALLYKARIDWALNYLDWKKLVISHHESNETSRRANQKWGFHFIGKAPRNWPDGTTADDWNYELDLEQLRQKQ